MEYDIDLSAETSELLGRGAFGSVYRARYMRQTVAVKMLNLHAAVDAAEVVQRFVAEVTAISKISHPNCIRFFGASLNVNALAMVTEFCPNGDLSDVIHRHGFVSRDEQLNYLLDICKGMAYLHERGMVHRDLKPENVLLDANFTAKVADFGLSTTDISDTSTVFCGTRAYMAPEVLRAQQNDKPADVWSFATLAWEAFTSIRPDSLRADVYAAPGNFYNWIPGPLELSKASGLSSGPSIEFAPLKPFVPLSSSLTLGDANGSVGSMDSLASDSSQTWHVAAGGTESRPWARPSRNYARISHTRSVQTPLSSTGSGSSTSRKRAGKPSVRKAVQVSVAGFDDDIIIPWPAPVIRVLEQAFVASPGLRPTFLDMVNAFMLGRRLVQLQTAIDARDVAALRSAFGGECALAHAHWKQKTYMPHYLATRGVVTHRSPLHLAAMADDLDLAAKLVRLGIPLCDMDLNGKTPLCHAHSEGMRKLLLEANGMIIGGFLFKRPFAKPSKCTDVNWCAAKGKWRRRFVAIEGFYVKVWLDKASALKLKRPRAVERITATTTVTLYETPSVSKLEAMRSEDVVVRGLGNAHRLSLHLAALTVSRSSYRAGGRRRRRQTDIAAGARPPQMRGKQAKRRAGAKRNRFGKVTRGSRRGKQGKQGKQGGSSAKRKVNRPRSPPAPQTDLLTGSLSRSAPAMADSSVVPVVAADTAGRVSSSLSSTCSASFEYSASSSGAVDAEDGIDHDLVQSAYKFSFTQHDDAADGTMQSRECLLVAPTEEVRAEWVETIKQLITAAKEAERDKCNSLALPRLKSRSRMRAGRKSKRSPASSPHVSPDTSVESLGLESPHLAIEIESTSTSISGGRADMSGEVMVAVELESSSDAMLSLEATEYSYGGSEESVDESSSASFSSTEESGTRSSTSSDVDVDATVIVPRSLESTGTASQGWGGQSSTAGRASGEESGLDAGAANEAYKTVQTMLSGAHEARMSFMCRVSGTESTPRLMRRVFKIPTEVVYMIDPQLVVLEDEDGPVDSTGARPMTPTYRGHFLFSDVMVKAFPLGGVTQGQTEALLDVLRMMCGVSHPNTVPTVGVAMSASPPQLLMVSEVMEPTSLFDALRSDQMMGSRMIPLYYAFEIARGMERLHELGIVHGNLHPANVLFDEIGTVRISHYGVTQLLMVITRQPEVIRAKLHPLYAAPEVLDGSGPLISQHADLWSLGVVVWACFYMSFGALSLPYDGKRGKDNYYAPPGLMDARTPPDVIELLNATFEAKNPSERPSAAVFAAVLLKHIVHAQESSQAWGRLAPWQGESVSIKSATSRETYSNVGVRARVEAFDQDQLWRTEHNKRTRRLKELSARLDANAGICEEVGQLIATLSDEFDEAALGSAPRSSLYSLAASVLRVMANVHALCGSSSVLEVSIDMLHRITDSDEGKVAVRMQGGGHAVLAILQDSNASCRLLLGALRLLVRVAYNDDNRDHLRDIGMVDELVRLLRAEKVVGNVTLANEVVNATAFMALTVQNKVRFGELGAVADIVEILERWQSSEYMKGDLYRNGLRGLGNLCVHPPNAVALMTCGDGKFARLLQARLDLGMDNFLSELEKEISKILASLWCFNSMARAPEAVHLIPTHLIDSLFRFATTGAQHHYRIAWILFYITIRLCVDDKHRQYIRATMDLHSLAHDLTELWAAFPSVATLAKRAVEEVAVENSADLRGPPRT
ncbi:HT1 protein kinase [Thecamonas trahens ATCC 50062]|uniref:HT1 protein kinase n=1 Tax=Thecamonas trahens ATCC 50062 TaxID=461836 RepID=A0A0L0DFW4_THETB|nr:HT1 protein kinase [Thecamonas trahens ATCC 50062]KNC51060.1 HT1 protein kinase [Thecamonas trahens ATCC 50062]|eukprot:XP_013756521.1 HT1 protein kinase [Thecamonas trahens ATCC 50062]